MRYEPVIPIVAVASLVATQAAFADPASDSAEAQAIQRLASADIQKQLGKPAELRVQALHSSGEWAFVFATMIKPDGQDFDYDGTEWAAAAEHGGKSTRYAGLFHNVGGTWQLTASAVGPTDTAWTPWSSQYGAPSEIFQTN
ncbi:hypothetical protein [Segniliparus rugosus]|uniref:Uncharacterized protein n=1 Tax=Segniliparus rugosus (strain ATCC BAA-974 / DSM 45345 / CCUG 50838 / CIP 108380 / JCM 13579 / CDC 945) TaxID=679197 RepID=E5XQ53_SEGRC|nr:hypothetical protein [Segniliparus rugosus]EFV13526.1 hypothetical protein HMPREF9336_01625 [Segniliparus rugosus ATCC BAA-974]